jgi:alkylhydroperoxidase family enzyme
MIQWLRHREIDPAAWDRAPAQCANRSWYALSSTLEAAAPGWDALMEPASGAMMPLPHRRKYGVVYLYQPFLIQHLGPFAPEPDEGLAARFLQAVPAHFRYADIYLAAQRDPALPRVRTEQRTDHLLQLDRPLEVLRAAYSENHRRSVRKAHQLGVHVEYRMDSGPIADLLESSEQFKRWRVDAADCRVMRHVFLASEAAGTGFGLLATKGNMPVAAGWFIKMDQQIIFLKGLATAQGRELRAMHALIDQVVADHAASGMVLDFAGGHDPQLARFYAGFGAEPSVYLRALMNRLPAPVRWLKP